MSDRLRRILVVRARSRKGPLTEPMADVQPARRELVFMPLISHCDRIIDPPSHAH